VTSATATVTTTSMPATVSAAPMTAAMTAASVVAGMMSTGVMMMSAGMVVVAGRRTYFAEDHGHFRATACLAVDAPSPLTNTFPERGLIHPACGGECLAVEHRALGQMRIVMYEAAQDCVAIRGIVGSIQDMFVPKIIEVA